MPERHSAESKNETENISLIKVLPEDQIAALRSGDNSYMIRIGQVVPDTDFELANVNATQIVLRAIDNPTEKLVLNTNGSAIQANSRQQQVKQDSFRPAGASGLSMRKVVREESE